MWATRPSAISNRPDVGHPSDSELVIRLTAHLEFGYADNRNILGDERRFGECIMVFFGPVPAEGYDVD